MIRRPPRSTRTDTLFPYTTLFRSTRAPVRSGGLELRALRLEAGEIVLRCPHRLFLRQEVIAREARLDRHDVAHLPELLDALHQDHRSEEHTSELQSLMRISYAVFCLKKKTNQSIKNTIHNNN